MINMKVAFIFMLILSACVQPVEQPDLSNIKLQPVGDEACQVFTSLGLDKRVWVCRIPPDNPATLVYTRCVIADFDTGVALWCR